MDLSTLLPSAPAKEAISPTVQGRLNNLRLNDLLPYLTAQLVDQCGREHFLRHVVIVISRVNEVKEQFCALYIKCRILYSVVSAVLGLPARRWFTKE